MPRCGFEAVLLVGGVAQLRALIIQSFCLTVLPVQCSALPLIATNFGLVRTLMGATHLLAGGHVPRNGRRRHPGQERAAGAHESLRQTAERGKFAESRGRREALARAPGT